MGLLDVVKSAFGVGKPKNLMTLRPTELDSWTRGSADIAKMPIIPFVGYRFVSEIYMYSDLLKTIIRSLVQETFRKGITIVPRFIVKCNICGSDYDTKVEKCEVCGSDSLRPPNYFEKEYLEKWLNDVNFNDQSLIEVLQDVDTDLNIYDNAYLAVVKRYFYNDEGEVVGSEVVEVLRANPEYVMLVIDREGRPARTDDGKVAMFCLEHRDRYVTLLPEQVEGARCTVCGKKLYPVYFTVRKWSQGGTVCYTSGEILHIKKFTHGLGYGISPIFSVWMKVLTLIKMDFFILTAYHLERPPKGVLVLRGQMESIQKAWHRLQEEARNNPHMIYPFVVEGADKAPRIAEWIDLSFSAKDIEFIQYREEIRRTVGALFGVMPIFQGDTSAGVGLANEGLQIVVTNRAVEREQTLFNEKVLPWLIRQMGVSDWEYQLIPNEGRDVVARIQRETMRIANAERMAALGYKPVAVKTDDGIDFYYVVGGKEIAESERSGYIASKVYQEIPEREIPRYEGEPEHGRPRTDEQRFEGEELARRPKEVDTFVVGEGGKLIPEGEVGKGLFLEKQTTVPEEYRRYISRDQLSKLPVGTRVHRGPRGGLFVDIRELPGHVRESIGEEREGEERQYKLFGAHEKIYSGSVKGEFDYDITIDPAGEVATVLLSKKRDPYRIKLEVGVNTGRVRVVEADIPYPRGSEIHDYLLDYMRSINKKDLKFVNKVLYAIEPLNYSRLPKDLGKIILNREIDDITSNREIKSILGKDIKLDEYSERMPELAKLIDDEFHRIGDSKIFVHNSLDVGAVENIVKQFKEIINDNFFSAIVIVPHHSLGTFNLKGKYYEVGGMHNPLLDVIFLNSRNIEYSIMHEYFHAVFEVYRRLEIMDTVIKVVRYAFYKSLDKAGFNASIINSINVDDEVVKRVIDRLYRYFDYGSAEEIVDYYLQTSDDSLPKVIRKMKKVISDYGGDKALEAYKKMVDLFLRNNGVTTYSHAYFNLGERGDPNTDFVVATESFASFGDIFEEIISKARDGVERFQEALIQNKGKIHELLTPDLYEAVRSQYKVHVFFDELTPVEEYKLGIVANFLKRVKGVFKG